MKQHRIKIEDSNVIFILDESYLYLYIESIQYKVPTKDIYLFGSNYIMFGNVGPAARLSSFDNQHISHWTYDLMEYFTIFLRQEDFFTLKAKLKEWKISLD